MDSRRVALIFGITFVAVGLIGFVPNPLVAPGGLFAVNAAHNLVHLGTGAAFLVAALRYAVQSRTWIQGIGAVYTLVAILGFIPALFSGEHLLGIVHINEADKWLHVGLAIAILAAGFLFPAYQPPRRAST